MQRIPVGWRWTLSFLRFLSLSTLCLLLAGTWIDLDQRKAEIYPLPIYLDGSESLQLDRPGWAGEEATEQALRDLLVELEQRQIPYELHSFAKTVDPSLEDSLWKSETRFDAVLQHILERSSQPAASLILSDGLDTHRTLDDFTPSSSLSPLYTISIGDSESMQDLVLEEILLPNPLNLHQRTRLWIRVSRSRLEPPSATIHMSFDDELQEPVVIDFSEQDSVLTESIPVQFTDTGRVVINVRLSGHESEWSTANNHWREERDVVDRRTVVWHIATSIHPDIRWVREQLRMDQQLNILSVNLFDRSVELPESSPDLIILHGDPRSDSWPPRLLHYLQETNVMWLAGTNGVATPDSEESVGSPARPRSSTGGPWQRPLSSIEDGQSHVLIEPFRAWINEALTPLWIHADTWESAPATRTIWMQGEPVLPFLVSQEVGNRRRILVTASGWYRFSHSERSQELELASELFSSITQWAVANQETFDSEGAGGPLDGSDGSRRVHEVHPSGRNDSLLQILSKESGGEWRTLNDIDRTEAWFHSLEQQVENVQWTRVRKELVSSPVWYLFVVLLLASEWTLRRRFRLA